MKPYSRTLLWIVMPLLLLSLLQACGFRMRGLEAITFKSVYIQSESPNTLAAQIERNLRNRGIRIEQKPENAEVHLNILGVTQDKHILSLSGAGKVKEYQLTYNTTIRMRKGKNPLWGEPQTVNLQRDFSYDDSQILAKQIEEQELLKELENNVANSTLRRLSIFYKQAD